MSIELIFGLMGLALTIIANIVALSVFMSKMNSRIKFCEDRIEVLFGNDKAHTNEMKILYEIKGQLELLSFHFKPIKN